MGSSTHLKPLEFFILKQLAKGRTYESIVNDPLTRKAEVSLPALHQLCLGIRKKTGIPNTRDPRDCREWLKRHPTGRIIARRESELKLEPTPTQERIMRMFMFGIPIGKIATSLGMGRQTALNHLSIGCRRAGVSGTGPYHKRIDAILDWFEECRPPATTMEDPMFQ